MAKKDLQLLHNEIQVGVSFTSFMTVVTMFFTGLLITQFEQFTATVRVPILFLIISTFGFLYSTLIYANASGAINRITTKRFDRQMEIGNILSEYLGVYFLILSIPLVINLVATDWFLKLSTLLVSLGGLAIYHISGFSIMDRHYKKYHKLLLSIILILECLLFYSQTHLTYLFNYIAVMQILLLLLISYFATKKL